MQLFIGTTEACDEKGALEIVNQIKNKPGTILGLATGSTPIGMYRNLALKCRAGEVSFSQVKTFNLDEYVGLPKDHPCSYYYFMQENLFKHIDIPSDAISLPNGIASDLEEECRNYEKRIAKLQNIIELPRPAVSICRCWESVTTGISALMSPKPRLIPSPT